MALRPTLIEAQKKSLGRWFDAMSAEQRQGETKEAFVSRELQLWETRMNKLLKHPSVRNFHH